ncbi:MAG TPA: sensor histidine kinase [Thermoanaerobaculia bacterium]|nr:sensor histidine kinase [Thermoanaerobaculia bacterium]
MTAFLIALLVLALAAWWLKRYGIYCQARQSGAADHERDRIAIDFHDNLAHGLTGATLHLEAAMAELQHGAAYDNLRQAQAVLQTTILDARRTLNRLRPLRLEREALVDAVRDMLRQMTEGLAVEAGVQVTGEPGAVAAEQENQLFRIVQEAVTNSLRHAGATRIDVQFAFAAHALTVTVRDDGRGTAAESDARRGATGSGVTAMRQRAEQIGARLHVTAGTAGHEVTVELPLQR